LPKNRSLFRTATRPNRPSVAGFRSGSASRGADRAGHRRASGCCSGKCAGKTPTSSSA